MYQIKSCEDTIVAISTPAGQGGIGIVRLSGKRSLAIADRIFQCKSKCLPSQCKSFSVHYGWVMSDSKNTNSVMDEALLTVMRGPKSYTKEDVVEISSHGGLVSLRSILSLAIDRGARLAEPGEFTKRAFLNGRIDLTQAEAVLDIIQSKTETYLRVSTHQLKGELSIELERIRECLMNVYVEIEAIINFPEDEIEAKEYKALLSQLSEAHCKVEKLLASSDQGKILREGIKIVICGRPNVGKSSLLNLLLKQPRAIVSEIAGTTRDTIEESAQIKGVPIQFVDTAGILEPRDIIEEEAVKRSRLFMESADLVLLVLDSGEKLTKDDHQIMRQVKDRNVLFCLNKCDLKEALGRDCLKSEFPEKKSIKVSATKKLGIEELESAILDQVLNSKSIDEHGILLSNVRHIESLKECQDFLQEMLEMFQKKISLEFVSDNVKRAVNCLDAITGRNVDEDLLETIFSQFCIGK